MPLQLGPRLPRFLLPAPFLRPAVPFPLALERSAGSLQPASFRLSLPSLPSSLGLSLPSVPSSLGLALPGLAAGLRFPEPRLTAGFPFGRFRLPRPLLGPPAGRDRSLCR